MYTGNHFFRVDKGFVAQTADVMSGSIYPMNEQQKAVGGKNVPLEVHKGVKHHEGK
jgi:cyclophilin family peptidyl-prolyl cis-trans isomerase